MKEKQSGLTGNEPSLPQHSEITGDEPGVSSLWREHRVSNLSRVDIEIEYIAYLDVHERIIAAIRSYGWRTHSVRVQPYENIGIVSIDITVLSPIVEPVFSQQLDNLRSIPFLTRLTATYIRSPRLDYTVFGE